MIEEIKNENLFKEIIKLKKGEKIFIDVDEEQCNRLKLAEFQKRTYENLFFTYINNTVEEANKVNLSGFLKCYTDICIKENEIYMSIIVGSVGKEVYLHMVKNNISYFVDKELLRINILK